MISFDEGSIIIHAKEPYNPAKAHEYYLRTRKLHPRKRGATFTVTRANGKTVKLTAKQLQEQKEYSAKRVAHIKKNLADLNVLLRDKLQKAKESAAKAAKPPTLAEKAKAAREAEKYRKSHKQSLANKAKQAASKAAPSKSKTPKVDTVDSLKADIKKTRANLKAAVANQRALATAKKNG
jgi:hypothetical protein